MPPVMTRAPITVWMCEIRSAPALVARSHFRLLADGETRKHAGYDDRYRLRVEDYRGIYEVMDRQLDILVVGVGHR
jgi:hypothetical protein